MKALSICIPTYNRASFLKEALESVFSQIEEINQDEIEIVISDNASHDDTFEIVKSFQKVARAPIIYHRNEENLGFDRNILKVVEKASGRYGWLLGDDDRLAPGAIKTVLKEISRHPEIDLFLGNRMDFNLTFSHRFRFVAVLKNDAEEIFDFRKITILSYLKKVRKLTGIFSYISNLVFKREKWLQVVPPEKFIGTGYVNVYMFMALLWEKDRGILKYLPDKIVQTRWGNDRGLESKSHFERVKMDVESFHTIAEYILKEPKLVRKVDNLVLKNDGFSWTVRARIACGIDFYRKVFPYLLKRYWSFPLFWGKVFPLVFLPVSLVKIMRWTYRKFIKQEPLSFAEIIKYE